METTFYTKNGVAVHSYRNPKIASFAISLFIRAGSMYENDTENGFAHFFEHIVFRNINTVMNGRLYETLDKCGLYFNAATYVNYIEFTISGASRHFEDAAEIIALVLSPFVLRSSEINVEKKRIKAEIREDDESSLDRFSDGEVYKGTALARPITGKCPDVDGFGIKKLKAERKRFLTKENIFFYVGGSFKDKDLQILSSLIEKNEIYSGETFSNTAPVPCDFKKRDCAVVVKNSAVTSVKLSFDVKSDGCTLPELFCLTDALFAGESCPMYRELSENTGLIYSYDEALSCFENVSFLSVSYDVRADKLIKSLETVIKMLARAKNNAGRRLSLITPAYTDNAYIMLDSAETICSDFGYYNHILGCKYYSVSDRISAFSSLSEERITALAQEVFVPDGLVIAIKGNKKRIATEEIKSLVKSIL